MESLYWKLTIQFQSPKTIKLRIANSAEYNDNIKHFKPWKAKPLETTKISTFCIILNIDVHYHQSLIEKLENSSKFNIAYILCLQYKSLGNVNLEN